MATAPTNEQGEKPNFGELAPMDDPLFPRAIRTQAAPYTDILVPSDDILQSKGAGNLRIYRELLRDDAVKSAWEQRRLALTSCETIVEPGADDELSKRAAEALQVEIDRMLWDDITDKQLYAIFYGWGVAECMWRPSTDPGVSVSFDRIVVRDRGRFRFGRRGEIYLYNPVGGWEEMPDRKFWKVASGADHHDEPYGMGLAHSLYWPVFFKRNGIKFWLIFLEKFGMPTALAKLPPGMLSNPDSPEAKALIGKAIATLRNIATDAGVVVPDNVVIELLEAARSGAADYESMKTAMDKAIAKIIVGQTATTDGTPGKLGNDKAQADVALSIVKADADLLCGSFNDGPVKWWIDWNFPGAALPRVYRQTDPPTDLKALAETDEKIATLGFEPDETYIQATYGPHWKKKQAPAMAPGMGSGLFGGPSDPGNADPAQFAEGDAAALQALRAANRGDQQAIVEAARAFAGQHETLMARRIGELLKAAEFSEDPQVFRQRLAEIMAEAPPPELTQAVARGGFFARMLGAFRTQRAA